MPFQSEKQRKYLWANEPAIARDWTKKYGSRVKKDNGGIMDSLSQSYGNVVGPHIQALYGPYGIAKTAPSSYDYHVLGTGDLTQRISDELKATGNPLSSAAFDYAAPGLAGALSIPYDALQAGIRTLYDKDWNFRGPLEGFDITDTMNPNYKSVPGFGTRWAQEKPLEAMIGRFTGAAQPLVNRWDKTGASLAKAWDAIKSEFGGSAEAAGVPINKFQGSVNYPQSKDLEAQASGMFKEEDENGNWFSRYLNPRNIAQGVGSYIGNKISGFNPLTMGFNAMRGKMPYRGATGSAGGYSASQLNSMNALGGYYSEPARQQRRMDARRTNILNRAAKGKAVGNVNNLLGKHGYKGTPGGGIQFTGQSEGNPNAGAGYSRSDSGWDRSPFKKGGIASLWQR